MSPPKPLKLIVVKMKPSLEDFPTNLVAFILVQPNALEAPTELYYLSNDVELLVLIAQENIESILAKLKSPIIDFDYSKIKINYELEKIIEAETHFSISNAVQNARKEKELKDIVKQREKSGILASNVGQPIRLEEHSCLIIHCNIYSDGNGDVGNVIDVARHIIEYTKQDSIRFYFVVTVTLAVESNENFFDKHYNYFLAEISNLFNKYPKLSFNCKENVFSFHMGSFPLHMDTMLLHGLDAQSANYNLLVNNNEQLKTIYENADAIFNIATPFPALPESIQLKPSAQIINITEHNGSSQWFSTKSIPKVHHYVTGIGENKSGLMIEDLSCNLEESIEGLKAIEKEYISKLGLAFPVSTKEAAQFLKNTLVVPVYLGEMQQKILAPLIYMVSQSPLASEFKNIVFHINQRSYNSEIFDNQFEQLENIFGKSQSKIQLIIGHFFKDEVDLRRLYQLSSGVGLALVSSDKVLELAISTGLFPIYPPVPWKKDVYTDFCELGKVNPAFTQLFSCLDSIDNKQLLGMALVINLDLLKFWSENLRPDLLKNSFFRIFQATILEKNIQEERKSPVATTFPRMFFQQPLEMIANQIQKLFSTQLTSLIMKSNKTLQFVIEKITNEEFAKKLEICEAKLTYLSDNNKHQIEIQSSENIQQFLIELGFNNIVLEKLCLDLNLNPRKPENSEANSCILM